MIRILPVRAFRDNYIWLITAGDSGNAAVVDPGDAAPVLDALQAHGLRLCAILITHHHADHTGGVRQLLAGQQVPVYGPARESIPGMDHALQDGDTVTLEELQLEFRVLDVPGHTAGHIAYYGHDCLFAGDTLFMAGCGRLFEGSAEQMHASLQKLLALPPQTRVYCAHEYTLANLRFAAAVEPGNDAVAQRTGASEALRARDNPTVPGSLEQERLTNPFLRTDQPAVIAAAQAHAARPLHGAAEVFAVLREWKDGF